MNPLFIMNMAGPCKADLLCMEWTKAMSSTQVANSGHQSVMPIPSSP